MIVTNCYLLSEGFVTEIVIITNFVVVSSVVIKRVVCTKFQNRYVHKINLSQGSGYSWIFFLFPPRETRLWVSICFPANQVSSEKGSTRKRKRLCFPSLSAWFVGSVECAERMCTRTGLPLRGLGMSWKSVVASEKKIHVTSKKAWFSVPAANIKIEPIRSKWDVKLCYIISSSVPSSRTHL